MWIYVGITARTAVSVMAQYVLAVQRLGLIPQIIKSDHGTETVLAADTHYMLSNRLRAPEDGSELRIRDCFRYGTSRQNSRIERWWESQHSGCIGRWRSWFEQLEREDDFVKDWLADRVAFVAVYIPIIRSVLYEFVSQWNAHKIRKQASRESAGLVTGIPNILYNYPELKGGEQCGIALPDGELDSVQSELSGFGTAILRMKN